MSAPMKRITDSWLKVVKDFQGIVLDIAGVLYDSGEGDGVAIPGSIEAVKRWKNIFKL